VMTTAASTGCGIARKRSGTNTSIRPPATRPVSYVLAPDWQDTAVLGPLVPTRKPEKRPAARSAEPMPIP
jgi:hypothetical protein